MILMMPNCLLGEGTLIFKENADLPQMKIIIHVASCTYHANKYNSYFRKFIPLKYVHYYNVISNVCFAEAIEVANIEGE